jgi:hypothetical protein
MEAFFGLGHVRPMTACNSLLDLPTAASPCCAPAFHTRHPFLGIAPLRRRLCSI